MNTRRLIALNCCVALLSAWLLTQTVVAQSYVINEVMSGLVSPRGLALGPDGALYVAEAGNGGSGPSIVAGTGNTVFYGTTGGVSRFLNGVQSRMERSTSPTKPHLQSRGKCYASPLCPNRPPLRCPASVASR